MGVVKAMISYSSLIETMCLSCTVGVQRIRSAIFFIGDLLARFGRLSRFFDLLCLLASFTFFQSPCTNFFAAASLACVSYHVEKPIRNVPIYMAEWEGARAV